MITSGYQAITGDGMFFGTDAAAEYFQDDAENRRVYWIHWSMVTGHPAPSEDAQDKAADQVRCAC